MDDERLAFLDKLFDDVEDRPHYGGMEGVSTHPTLDYLPMRKLGGDFEGITGRQGREPISHNFPFFIPINVGLITRRRFSLIHIRKPDSD